MARKRPNSGPLSLRPVLPKKMAREQGLIQGQQEHPNPNPQHLLSFLWMQGHPMKPRGLELGLRQVEEWLGHPMKLRGLELELT
mgnify:CR=1 FL=1